jgi:O-antigen ligase
LAPLLGTAIVYLPPQFTFVAAALLASVIAAFAIKMDVITIVAALVFALSALVDMPRAIPMGPTTALAALALLYAAVGTLLWLAHPRLPPCTLIILPPMAAFHAWTLARAVTSGVPIVGMQNLLSFATLQVLIIGMASATQGTDLTARQLNAIVRVTTALAVILYAIPAVAGPQGPITTSGRPFALFALFGVAAGAARHRYTKRGIGMIILFLTAILLSLSRSALVVALLLLPLTRFDPRNLKGWSKSLCGVILCVLLLLALVQNVKPLRERFTTGDIHTVGSGIRINTSGRYAMWTTIWDSFSESPWIGKGPGSSTTVLANRFVGISHPHNDYLRILHDYGLIGLGFWMWLLVALLSALYRSWRSANQPNKSEEAQLKLVAFSAFIAFMLVMFTDNPVTYAFVIGPLGALLGIAIGSWTRTEHRVSMENLQ